MTARVAVVTGAGRRAGIGFAIAQRLLADGLSVLIHSWGDDPAEVIAELGGVGPRLRHVEADFADPAAPANPLGGPQPAFCDREDHNALTTHQERQRLEKETRDE